ncbi:MAG: YgiQ family radical SAM protein, partial [Firmicutes bacterium]|nr:YgiQ family radical SAM protein [Bacillota bacterium]
MFLPITMGEVNKRGWEQVDFVIVTGDAYCDHHSFGTAIIGRLLERYGYRVAILPQPDYKSAEDFRRFGRPRLGFLINSGVVDSMVNNYSVFKHRRRVDEYSPGGKAGARPDRALTVYANRAREAYKDVPIIIGGLEASLRRMGHYDYWSDKVRRSVLLDSKADLLVYGMGEKTILEIAEALECGIDVSQISWIRGTCYRTNKSGLENLAADDCIRLPSFEEITESKKAYAHSFKLQHDNMDSITAKTLIEEYPGNSFVVQNPPQAPLEREELDDIYDLPFENEWHPSYDSLGGIPAFKEIKFSVVSSRG